MKIRRWIPLAGSVLLVALAVAGLVWTRDLGEADEGAAPNRNTCHFDKSGQLQDCAPGARGG
ncbi:MAG: hypothetical protein IPP78_01115 [Holophagaceae bacterium]|nr:hypothetical protein [Holophagaceae bacterium]